MVPKHDAHTRAKCKSSAGALESSMLSIKLEDRVRNTEIRCRTKIRDVVFAVMTLKWNWVGHVIRRKDYISETLVDRQRDG